MATAPPPLPPEVEQQQDPAQAQSVFAQQGMPQPQPGVEQVKALAAKLQELERWVMQVRDMTRQVDPNLQNFLVPILNGGKQMSDALQRMLQQSGMATGSPQVPPTPPQNPGAGPPNPAQM